MLTLAIGQTPRRDLSIVLMADADDAGESSKAAEIARLLTLQFPKVSWAIPPESAKDVRDWVTNRSPEESWADRGQVFLETLT